MPVPNGLHQFSLAARSVQFAKFTTPVSSTTAGQIRVTYVTQGDIPSLRLLVKSSNQGASPWPTLDDYDAEYAQYLANINLAGTQVDWVRDSNGGVYWYNFGGETVIINKTYSGHPAFNQADTYYVLIYNPLDTPNGFVRVNWYPY